MRTENEFDAMLEVDVEQLTAEFEEREEEEALKPRILFKYKSVLDCTDFERVCTILQDNSIYMASPRELNDPLEGYGSIVTNGSAERDAGIKCNRILALSENCLSPTLWAHYGGNYSGVCIGYWRQNAFIGADKVIYGEDSGKSRGEVFGDPTSMLYWDFRKKNGEWKYEKEWRVIRTVLDEKDKLFLDYTREEVACIMYGNRVSPFIRKVIQKYVPESVPTYTVSPDTDSYCLYAKNNASGKQIRSIEDLLNDLQLK